MKIEKIKPIPKYIIKLIQKKDNIYYPSQSGNKRFYSYLTKNDGELVQVTVCCRNRSGKWYCKQVAIHGVDSKYCFVKDMYFTNLAGYIVGWHEEGLSKHQSWYERGWGWAEDKYFSPFAPLINIEYALKIDEFKYSAVNKHVGDNAIKYLRMYRQYPQMEYLTKLGLHDYVMSKQILTLVGKDKSFRKYISKNAKDINRPKDFYVQSIIKAYKTGGDINDIDRQEKMIKNLYKQEYYDEIKEIFKGKLINLVDYLYNQGISSRLYIDYIRACKGLDLDLTEERNLFPRDFMHWHDVRIDENRTKQAIDDAEKRKDFYCKFLHISTKYFSLEHQNGTFAVVIAKSPAELINEGDVLHHCVGRMGYDQKFTREESLIFFLRDVNDLNKPLVTIEYSPKTKKILQCYGEYNSMPNDNVLDYINKQWLPYAKQQLLNIAA